MKIIIASDIHGRIASARKLFDYIDEINPDKIFLLGDLLYNGPRNGVPDDYDPMEVANLINKHLDKCELVKGNCDSRIDSDVIGKPLQDFINIHIDERNFHLFHGDLSIPSDEIIEKGDILCSGHTHIWVLEDIDGLIHLNPGSIGFPKGGNPSTLAIYEDGYLKIINLDNKEIIKSICL